MDQGFCLDENSMMSCWELYCLCMTATDVLVVHAPARSEQYMDHSPLSYLAVTGVCAAVLGMPFLLLPLCARANVPGQPILAVILVTAVVGRRELEYGPVNKSFPRCFNGEVSYPRPWYSTCPARVLRSLGSPEDNHTRAVAM